MADKTTQAFYRGKKGWGFYFELPGGELIMLISPAGGPDESEKSPLRKGDLCELSWKKESFFEGWAYDKRLRRGKLIERLSFYSFLLD